MTQIADDLVDISLIRQGKLRLRKRVVELAPILERAIDAVDAATTDRPRTLEVTKPAEPVYVFADSARIQQVFVKLLLNAAMHTNTMGRIQLDMRLDGDHIEIAVADDGAGIEPGDLPYLFDMHFRARRGGGEKPGIGLGLPLVRALVDLHGGSVSARSDGPGTGSVFTVRLPTATPQRLRALMVLH